MRISLLLISIAMIAITLEKCNARYLLVEIGKEEEPRRERKFYNIVTHTMEA